MSVVQRRGDPEPSLAPPKPPAGPAAPGSPAAPAPDDARAKRRRRIVLATAILALIVLGLVFPAAIYSAVGWGGAVMAFIAGLFATVVATVIAAAATLGRRATGTGDDGVWHGDATTASAWGLAAGGDARPDSSPSGGYDSAADAGSSGSSDSGSSGGGDSGGGSSSSD